MLAHSAVSRLPVGAGSGAVRELAKKAVRFVPLPAILIFPNIEMLVFSIFSLGLT